MAKISKITGMVLGSIFAATALTAANDAFALERGCQNADVVRQALRDEGQFVLITAVGVIPSQPRNIFTSNATGSVGYRVEQGTGGTTGQLCVGIKYTDIRVNTNSDLSTPSWALMGTNTAHDQWLRQTQSNVDNRVLMGATVLRDVNGQDVRGGFMMVTRGNVDQNNVGHTSAGAVTLSFSNGQIDPALLLANVEKSEPNYTTYATKVMTVASLNRN